jgi:hypothetical protein
MTAEPAMALPGSRALLGWWRELGPVLPRRMWYAQPTLSRLEALAEVAGLPALDALAHSLAVFLSASTQQTPATVAAALGVPLSLVQSLLRSLTTEGLVQQSGGEVRVTPAGKEMVRSGGEGPPRLERRVFRFTTTPAHFVALSGATPYAPLSDWEFDMGQVEQALARPDDWKRRHGFPLAVRRVLAAPAEPSSLTWPSIPLAAAEVAHLVVVESASASKLIAYPAQPDGWGLGREPVWELPSAGELAEVFGEVTAEDWKGAWLAWCHQRNLPATEAEACRLELQDHKLTVHAPAKLVDRLRQARSDAVKGEAWLTGGHGRLRGLARIELSG